MLTKCTDEIPNLVQSIRLEDDYTYRVKLFDGYSVFVECDSINLPHTLGLMDAETLFDVEAYAIDQVINTGHWSYE
jgi:hypothetical protein